MIASLPMYDWPEVAAETDALWDRLAASLRDAGFEAPLKRAVPDDLDTHWRSLDLLLSQTCGYPWATRLRDDVRLVATPTYDVEGCGRGTYSSAVIVRADDHSASIEATRDHRLAFNGRDSLSGWRCLVPLIGDPDAFFRERILSGSHRRSAELVANGTADIAAIDAVCWHMLRSIEAETAGQLRVLTWGPEFPALPLITAGGWSDEEVDRMFQAVDRAVEDLGEDLLLPLVGVEPAEASVYAPLAKL